MAGWAIRHATPGDAEALAGVWRDAGRHFAAVDPAAFQVPREAGLVAWLRSTLPAPSDPREAVLVAEREGRVVGFAAARIAEREDSAPWQLQREMGARRVVIDAVSVLAPESGAGAGGELVRAAERWGRERGAEVAVLDANWASGVAVGFHERRLGYERRGLSLRRRLTG
jgi:GNAT superfamily N-acetyltransferase